MTSRYRHRRTPLTTTPFPSPIEPGEIVVNTANRQIAVGDAAAGTLGQPKALIGVRFFDPTASYVLNDVVTQTGKIYKANGSIAPGAFNASNWTEIGAGNTAANVTLAPTGNVSSTNVQAGIAELDAEKAAVTYVDAADAALQASVAGKVAKAGDTMSGPLVLPGAPTADLQASTKKYVDDRIATVSAVYVSDTAPAGAAANALWWESDSGLLYINYNDGNTTQWVIACPQPDISSFVQKSGDTMTGPLVLPAAAPTLDAHAANKKYVDDKMAPAVRYDAAQSLTAAQQLQARQNIYAAPFDALAYNGMQINGSIDVSQERGASGTIAAATYPCDNWKLYGAGTMAVLAAQAVLDVNGFSKCLTITATTGQASLGAGDFICVLQSIEGYRVARLNWGTASAQPITVGFWSAHHRTGVYSVQILNAATNRSYVFTYTQTVADVLQYNVATIPGCTDGAWPKDNSVGLAIAFTMASGSTYTASAANTWLTGNFMAAPGQVNAVATTSDAFRITGVTILPGNEAPSAARSPFIMRPFTDELQACQRYYEKTYPYADKPGSVYGNYAGGGAIGFQNAVSTQFPMPSSWLFKVRKRATPTAIIYSPQTGASGGFYIQGLYDLAAGASAVGENLVGVVATGGTTVSPGSYCWYHAVADARL